MSKRDRSANTNYSYTYRPSWMYRPPQNYIEKSPFNMRNSTEEKICRSGIVFVNKNKDAEKVKFLVVRGKESGIWSFPKGRKQDDEIDEVCAIREVSEETGIQIDNLDNRRKFKVGRNTYFIIEVDDINLYNEFNITDTFEVDLVEWKSVSELRQLDCNKDIRAVLTYPEKKLACHQLLF
jgi:8-oxo-dGTP pyrophosphatase MutT (NUDIX family)